ncbi:MAG: class I SAM-dependent methyltransferase, partial [Sandarakinorhabdus sp.]|nr:class I SAM-dependent methyltransferase [Sandarakinorhabdus sp.]
MNAMLNTFQQADHAVLPRPDHDERARQEFTKSLKGFVQSGLLPGLGPVFKARAAKRFEREHGRAPKNRHDIRKAMVTDAYFQHYAATNRIAQELIWDSVIDTIERQLPEIEARAAALSAGSAAPLEASDDFATPRYVT